MSLLETGFDTVNHIMHKPFRKKPAISDMRRTGKKC